MLRSEATSQSSRREGRVRVDRWMRIVLWLAAVYHIAWGTLVASFPLAYFRLAGMNPPEYPWPWQYIGVIVAAYGTAYALAARDPMRYWPIVLVGLLSKTIGPIWFLVGALPGEMPWVSGWIVVLNDLIWWIPFAVIVRRASRILQWRET